MAEPHNKHEGDGQVELDTDEARAGTAPGMMRYVLIISTLLAIVALGIIWWAF